MLDEGGTCEAVLLGYHAQFRHCSMQPTSLSGCFALSGFYKIFQRQFIYAKIIYTIYVVCVKELYRLNYQCLVDTLLGLILHINHNIK